MNSTHSRQQELIGRSSLFWLLLTHFAVIAPLSDKATPWTLAISGICLVWRTGIFFGKVARPPRLLVTALGVASATTLALVSKEIGLLKALINLLILGYSLKTIEMTGKRDVRTVILAGYFLISLSLIDSPEMGWMLLALALLWLNTQALLSLYRHEANKKFDTLAAKLLLQSLPLAALLFLVLPRLPPLWMVPHIKSSTTGLADEVGFGDITRLTRSDALVFRVSFDGPIPVHADRYWRTLVMEDFDGRHWRQHAGIRDYEKRAAILGSSRQAPASEAINYRVIAEPSGKSWLYGLDVAYSEEADIINLPDYRLLARRALNGRFQYHAKAFHTVMDNTLTAKVRATNLRLPESSNPRTRAWVNALQEEYPEPAALLDALMAHFAKEQYFYTLQPPPVGQQQIDDFLFDNKRGFCVHYASALAFMVRAAGIPARLVTGYQGGEFNPTAGYLSIYQYMAHAWTEVWLEGRGWVRFDPTAMIAPTRILDGFDATFSSDEAYLANTLLSAQSFKAIPWLNDLRLTLASLDYYWSIWVLGFDNERREVLLKGLLGNLGQAKLILFVLGCSGIILLLVAWHAGILRLPSPRPMQLRGFSFVELALTGTGLPRFPGEGPLDYSRRAAKHLACLEDEIITWGDTFTRLNYDPQTMTNAQARAFLRLSRVLSRKIKRHSSTLTVRKAGS